MPRHSMNKTNRAMLERVTANTAAIAEAGMSGSASLPEYNPAANPGPINYPGLPPKPKLPGSMSTNLLSGTQQTWLHRRGLWFASALQQITGQTIADPVIVEQAAYMAAVALVGDDYDPLTQGITPGWTSEQWSAAFDYVKNNLPQWWNESYGATLPSKHQGHIDLTSVDWGPR